MFILFLFLMGLAYLCGSISSAVMVSKMLGLPDPRTQGSGSAGATNVLRISGKQVAIFVLVFDILKGFIPVLIAHWIGFRGMSIAFIGMAAVVGHIFPVFFEFKGGKGVATGLGVTFGLSFMLGIFACIVWGIVAAITRYSSLASLIATGVVLLFSTVFVGLAAFLPLVIMVGLIVWKHMDNIERLRQGTESKISF